MNEKDVCRDMAQDMDLRDYFAGLAMQALISKPQCTYNEIFATAYDAADKMLAERAK